MFSATANAESEKATARWLHKPVRADGGSSTASISSTVLQAVHICAEHKKPQKLMKHLQKVKVAAFHTPFPSVSYYSSSADEIKRKNKGGGLKLKFI